MTKMYRRLCKGLTDIGELIPAEDNIYDHIDNLHHDWYISIYQYNEHQYTKFNQIVEKINTRTGLPYQAKHGAMHIEDVITNKLIFDFDSKDISKAKDDTIELCSRLIAYGLPKESLQITFSGNKGYGVEIDTDQYFDPQQFKNIVGNLAKDLKTFDPKIWNASRIIRIPYSRHQESGLYKIPLELDELVETSSQEIKNWAKNTDLDVYIPETWNSGYKLPDKIFEMWQEMPQKAPIKVSSDKLDLDLKAKPKWLSNWKYALLNGYFPEGTRDYAIMILAATMRGQNLPREVTYKMLKGAIELQVERFGGDKFSKREIYRNVSQVYSSNWKGGTYSEENFPEDLKEYLINLGIPGKEEKKSSIISSDDLFNIFDNFATNIRKNTIKTGVDPLDKICRITTSMLVGVLGSPASGKSSFAIEMIKESSKNDIHSLFFSLDMGPPLIYQKLAQKETQCTGDKLFELFENKDENIKEITKIRNTIDRTYKANDFCFKTALTVEDIKDEILQYQEKIGQKVRLVVVDYLECLSGKFSDPTANTAHIAQQLKDLVNELDLTVVLLLQPPKRVGDPSEPIMTYRAIKGSSAVEQACSVIIGLWREGFHPKNIQNDKYMSFAVLKNRMGSLGQCDCSWDGLTGSIAELDDFEKSELEGLRAQLNMEKTLENKDF